MRHWKGQESARCLCLNQSKHTRSWCEKWVWVQPHLCQLMTQNQVVVTITDNESQSQPCITIHNTHDETLEVPSSCKVLELAQTHLILGGIVGVWTQNCNYASDSKVRVWQWLYIMNPNLNLV